MLEQIIGFIVAPAVTAFLAWFFTRKKNQAEVETVVQDAQSKELDNIESAIEIWRKIAQDLKLELAEIRQQNKEIQEQNKEIQQQNKELEQQNVSLLDKVTTLEQDYNGLLTKYESLKKNAN